MSAKGHGGGAGMRAFGTLGAAFILALAGPVAAGPAEDLAALMAEYDEIQLELYPTAALWRGDRRYLDRYEEDLTDAHLERRRAENARFLEGLAAIPRSSLDRQDALSHDLLAWELDMTAAGLAPMVGERFQLLPINHFYGNHQGFAREMQWRGQYPFRTPEDYAKAAARAEGFARWVDQAIAAMHQGIAQGVVQPKIVVTRMIPQVDVHATTPPEESVFYGAITNMPDDIAGADRERIAADYGSTIETVIIPAYRRLAAFLKGEYLPAARDAVGLSAMPGGGELYLYLVRLQTTTETTPDEFHAIGLAEVARITAEMERVKEAAGFEGTLGEFRTFLRTDARFKFADEAAMMAEYARVKEAALAGLPRLFGRIPETPYELRFFEPFVAPTKASAEYNQPSADGTRPGIFWINSYDLPSRPTYTSEVLSIHEAVPGHHMQITLAIENEDLPAFRRFGGPTAFVEGWGLYSESLGKELGLYTDPYQEFGALSFDMWRACRLVVDTGMHWKGWTREQAIRFMLDNTALTETDVIAEVERYIALPGQALAYKAGQLKISALRARAEAALGADFDLRAFHDEVLIDGAMPLSVLEAKIERWIAAQKGE